MGGGGIPHLAWRWCHQVCLPTLRWEWEDWFMLVVTSTMKQLTIGPDCDIARGGGNLLPGQWRSTIFMQPTERSATSLDTDASKGPIIEDVNWQGVGSSPDLPLGRQIPTCHGMIRQSCYLPLGGWVHDGTFRTSTAGWTSSCMNIPVMIVFILIYILEKVLECYGVYPPKYV